MDKREAIEQVVNIIACSESEEGHAYLDAIEEAREQLGDNPYLDTEWHRGIRSVAKALDEGWETHPMLYVLEGFLPKWAVRKLAGLRHDHKISLEIARAEKH